VSAYLKRDQILAARATIDPAFLDSPVMRHAGLDEALGCAMILKVETINPIRSFKGRGTEAVLESLAPRPAGVVAASTGNFGQGIAWSARRRGISATICVPANANPSKVDAMRRLGATVIVAVPETDEADAARSMAGESNLVFIEDGAFPEIAGAGSIAQELTAAGVTPDIMLVQIGDGALIGGIGSWLKAAAPRTSVIGVTAVNSPAMAESVSAGRSVERPANTIADGMAVRRPIPSSLELVRAVVDDIIAVSEDGMIAAMRLLIERAGLLAEPSGAAGVAAVMEHGDRFRGAHVAAVITGSNLDPRLLPQIAA
jgi:threonine dehydratase